LLCYRDAIDACNPWQIHARRGGLRRLARRSWFPDKPHGDFTGLVDIGGGR
jgi:hypothetical protein